MTPGTAQKKHLVAAETSPDSDVDRNPPTNIEDVGAPCKLGCAILAYRALVILAVAVPHRVTADGFTDTLAGISTAARVLADPIPEARLPTLQRGSESRTLDWAIQAYGRPASPIGAADLAVAADKLMAAIGCGASGHELSEEQLAEYLGVL